MSLDDFSTTEPIFVDANIWTYFALNSEPFQTSCTTFLYRIEAGQVSAVISTAVLNEVFYAILIGQAGVRRWPRCTTVNCWGWSPMLTDRLAQIASAAVLQTLLIAAAQVESLAAFTERLDQEALRHLATK